MDKANTVQGFLHAFYSFGALFSPLIATSMVVSAGLPWYTFYYVMVSHHLLYFALADVVDWHFCGGMGWFDCFVLAADWCCISG
jgi:hypothetical protein